MALWMLIIALFFGGAVPCAGMCPCNADVGGEPAALCDCLPEAHAHGAHHHPGVPCHHHQCQLQEVDEMAAPSTAGSRYWAPVAGAAIPFYLGLRLDAARAVPPWVPRAVQGMPRCIAMRC